MSQEPAALADRAFDALPLPLREREDLRLVARAVAAELVDYGNGIVAIDGTGDAEGMVRMLCEDMESSQLLADFLATGDDEEEAEITPEERKQQILEKAEEVRARLSKGNSLQELIRAELADTDCGACDHPTCDLYSVALAEGSDPDNTKCEPGGPKVTAQVELVMEVAQGKDVDAAGILAIEAKAKDEPKREGGLRVLEIGSGHGMPVVFLAYLYPEAQFDVIHSDEKRAWLTKRLVNLVGVRNCRVHPGEPRLYYPTLASAFDLVLVKHATPLEAVRSGAAFARGGGHVISWQDRNWANAAADYQHDGPGYAMPLQAPRYFHSAPVDKHVLLLARRPEVTHEDETAPPQANEEPVQEAPEPNGAAVA